MTATSPSDLLALHAVRVIGFADTPVLARRFSLDPAWTQEYLRDREADGWVTYRTFAGTAGWSLTAHGRAENERQLAAELADTDSVGTVRAVHEDFVPLNTRLQQACTDWQIRPVAGDLLVPNDHQDAAWDARIFDKLDQIEQALAPLVERLAGRLARFEGYDTRFSAALARAHAGDHDYVDRTDVDSCHRVWFELHEDLIATLGIDRGSSR